jgi:hypothetical protein
MPSVSNHLTVDCPAIYKVTALFSQSEDGEPLVVPIIASTFKILSDRLALADTQLDLKVGGEYWGESGESSVKSEPQTAFTKPATDIVLIGHAFSVGQPTVDVTLEVANLRQTARVFGDRYWIKSLGFVSTTPPEPFEKIPLVYERAFGGWDRTNPDPSRHCFESRNPIGTGFRSKHGKFEDGVRMPNIENPKDLLSEYGQIVPPVGFGFMAPDWQPRAKFAGSYDQEWMDKRMPLLPNDFDRKFFNAAPPELVASGYLRGDEPISIKNASARGLISFNLPKLPPPCCRLQLKGSRDVAVETNLDTVIINTDEDLLTLLWRGYLPLRNGPLDITTIQVRAEGAAEPIAAA